MTLSGKLVQVARPTQENSLAEGMVGTAWSAIDMDDDPTSAGSAPDMYILEAEGLEDQEKIAGLLFSEAELEPLP